MISAKKLLTAAFALATIASVAMPTVQTAEVAGGPDLLATIESHGPAYGAQAVFANVRNVGTAPSSYDSVRAHCGYAPDVSGSSQLVDRRSQPISSLQLQAPLPKDGVKDANFHCAVYQGRAVIAVRLEVIPSSADGVASNNVATEWAYRFD